MTDVLGALLQGRTLPLLTWLGIVGDAVATHLGVLLCQEPGEGVTGETWSPALEDPTGVVLGVTLLFEIPALQIQLEGALPVLLCADHLHKERVAVLHWLAGLKVRAEALPDSR